MKNHLSDDLLERFDAGRLTSMEATRLAAHLDACPLCVGRVQAIDPLAPAFAAVDDPPLPDGLERAILEQAARPPAPIRAEWPVAGVLLAAAAALLLTGGDPAGLATAGGRIAGSTLVVGDVVGGLLPSPMLLLATFAVAGLASSLAAFGLLGLSREAS